MSREYYAIQRDASGNSLKHWKYIKREKKGGKWRYYYDTAKTNVKNAIGIGLKDEMADYQKQSERAAVLRDISLHAKKSAFDKYTESNLASREIDPNDRPFTYHVNSNKVEHCKNLGEKYCKAAVKYSDKVVKSNEKYRAAKKIYDKSLIGTIDKAVKWFKGLFK